MGANTVIEQSPGVVLVTGAAIVPNVQSVNTKTGSVSLVASDVGAPSLAQLSAAGTGNGANLVGFQQPLAGAVTRTSQQKAQDFISVKDWGAKGDGITLSATVSITSGAAALIVTGASFLSTDVGKTISVTGAGASGATLMTTISAYTSSTQVTLGANASTTLASSAQTVVYGTDDTSSISAADSTAAAAGVGLYFPNGQYLVNNSGITMSGASWLGASRTTAVLKALAQSFPSLGSVASISGKSGFSIESLGFDLSSGVFAAGSVYSAFAPVNCNNWSFRRCSIFGMRPYTLGVAVNGGSNWDVSGNYFTMPTPSGNQNQAVNVSASAGAVSSYSINNNVCTGTAIYTDGSDGTISGNLITGWKFGSGVTTGTVAVPVSRLRITNNLCSGSSGIDSNSFYPAGIECWAQDSQIIGNTCLNNSGHGIQIGAPFINVIGNTCMNNGQSVLSNGAGIYGNAVTGGSNLINCMIAKNVSTDTQTTKTQTYGYKEVNVSGTISNNYILDNNFDRNLTGTTLIVGSPISWKGPVIYLSTSFGPGTVSNGATAFSIYTIAGAALGDNVRIGFLGDNQGCVFFGYVSSATQVTICVANVTGSSKTFSTANVNIWIEKATGYTSLT